MKKSMFALFQGEFPVSPAIRVLKTGKEKERDTVPQRSTSERTAISDPCTWPIEPETEE